MVGIFFCLSILAALVLWREARREGARSIGWFCAVLWLAITMVMVKSVGALTISVGIGLVAGLLGRRLQILLAAIVVGVVLLYPVLRGAGFVPVDEVYEIALSYSEERAQSLKFRLDNEDVLLARANEKPLSGWGGWGRHSLFDPVTGQELSVTDGIWIILIGQYGWLGYIAYFGLLTAPILLYARHARRFGPSLITPGLLLLMTAVLIDCLPNAGLVPYVWMMAGALTGFVMQPARAAGEAAPATPQERPMEAASSWLMQDAASPGRRPRGAADGGRGGT